MKKNLIKIFALCFVIFAFISNLNIYGKELYWYCKRNREHLQPELDKDFTFIENLGGLYVDKKHSDNCDKKVIYLTFDVGYENGNVEKILDVMRDEGVKGSFFILGHLIDSAPNLVLRMSEEGYLVCNHTLNHKKLTSANKDLLNSEIIGLEEKYKSLTGLEMAKFFRPPEGTFSKKLLEEVAKLGYKTVFWSFAYADWDNGAQMSQDVAMKKILDNLHNGEIMLLHPTSATNAEIMRDLIRKLKAQGYCFATLDEL